MKSFIELPVIILLIISSDTNLSGTENSKITAVIKARYDKIERILDKYKIPYRISLNQLNKARVNFKHFGLLTIKEDVNRFSRDLELLFIGGYIETKTDLFLYII